MNITVSIPVGPKPHNQRYLEDCLRSVAVQTLPPDEILLIDDMAGIDQAHYRNIIPDMNVNVWESPWYLGIPHAFNFGVALARNDMVVMLGSDDMLQPWALEDLQKTWLKNRHRDGYYWFDVEYMDTGETQSVACNCAAMTKGLLRSSGGFPLESTVGACDTMLLSILLKHENAGRMYKVESSKPPFLYRRHKETDTFTRVEWYGVIATVRDLVTKTWRPK